MSVETNEIVLWACLGGGSGRSCALAWAAPAGRRPFLPLPPGGAPRRLHRLGGEGRGAQPRGEFLAALLPCGPGRRTTATGLLGAEACWGLGAALGWLEAPGPGLAQGFGWFCESRGGWLRRASGRLSGRTLCCGTSSSHRCAPLPSVGRDSAASAPASSVPGKRARYPLSCGQRTSPMAELCGIYKIPGSIFSVAK